MAYYFVAHGMELNLSIIILANEMNKFGIIWGSGLRSIVQLQIGLLLLPIAAF
jgi:hypothetical protein